MPKGVYPRREPSRRASQALAVRNRRRYRARWSAFVAACQDKWDVWLVAYRAGYKAGANVGERRGFAKGYEQALRDTRMSA